MKQTIVFINPPLQKRQRYGILGLTLGELQPVGLCYLAAITRGGGFKTYILDSAALNLSVTETVTKTIALNPNFVGISATTPAIHNAAAIAKLLKHANPALIIIIGGRHISVLPEKTMQLFPQFDCGVIGEGENNIIELLNLYSHKEEPLHMKGIIYRKNGKLIVNSSPPSFSELDSLGIPAYDLLEKYRRFYKPNLSSLNRLPVACVVSSRGCNHKCSFCEIRVFYNQFRYHSSEYLLDLIRYLKKYCGIREINFKDSNITIPKARLLRFCELIQKDKLDITWSCMARADTVTREVLKEMQKAGCWQIGYGIESGSQHLLDFLKKDLTLTTVSDAIKWTREAGIQSMGYFMIGLPNETEESLEKTIKFIRQCNLDAVKVNFFTPYPGCEIERSIVHYGAFEPDWEKMTGGYPVFIPSGMTVDRLLHYSKKCIKKFYLQPKIFIATAKRIKNPRTLINFFKGFWAILRYGFGKSGTMYRKPGAVLQWPMSLKGLILYSMLRFLAKRT